MELGPEKGSEQLPCRSAEVKFFSVFLCQRCREIWREILGDIFRATFSRVWVCDGKFHVKNGVKNGKFHANFTLPGRSAEKGSLLRTRRIGANSEKLRFSKFPLSRLKKI